MPHPSIHLHARKRAQKTADDAWAAWDDAWTRHIRRLTGRADLTVVVAPGAGGGAPACFYPSLKRVEVDAKYVGSPDVANPRRAAHKQQVPTAYGLLVHEAGHAAHSRWHTPPGTPPIVATVADLLEESRAESRQRARRRGDRRWLRHVVTTLITAADAPVDDPWHAGQLAGLLLARVDARILTAKGSSQMVGALTWPVIMFKLSRRGHPTDRYTEAIAQLASDKPTERLGGIYALEHLMADSERDHSTVVEVLAGSPGGTSLRRMGPSQTTQNQASHPRYDGCRYRGAVSAWYRGDCHVHSVHSGWALTPAQIVADARAMGLDFLAATEHRDAGGYEDWARQDLLVIPGREATTDTGHWLALGIPPGHVVDWRYGVRDGAIDRYVAEVHRLGGLCVAAHPHAPYPSGQFMYSYAGIDVVEVWNGPWTSDRPWQADNESALAEWGRALGADVHSGQWRPAMGNSDTHYEGQLGIPHTVVLAESLTAGAVLAGIRAGRSWIAASTDVSLSVTASTGGQSAGIGERLAAPPDAPVLVRVEVRGVPSGTVSLHTERGPVHRESLARDRAATLEWATTAASTGFVRVEVRLDGGPMAALSNPVLLG